MNQAAFKHICADFNPQVVFFWNVTHISVSLGLLAQERGLPTCYYIFDNWLATWEMDHWYQLWRTRTSHASRRVLAGLSRFLQLTPPISTLDLSHVIFASTYLKSVALNVAKPVAQAKVIPWGIDTSRYSYQEPCLETPKRLLYVGQIRRHKGVHTAIKALGILKHKHGFTALPLTIVGDVESSTEYVSHLLELSEEYDVLEDITFAGKIAYDQIHTVYHDHHILIFPSVWDEPFGMTLLEAMSCGLAVVGTATGGTSEILEDGQNALIFPKENAVLCAQQIVRLFKEPGISTSIRQNARRTVEERFQIGLTLDSIEQVLLEAATGIRHDPSHGTAGPRVATEEGAETLNRVRGVREANRRRQLLGLVITHARLLRDLMKFPFWNRMQRRFLQLSLNTPLILTVTRFFSFFADKQSNTSKIDFTQIQSVLVLQLADLGDAVLTSPFLRELRKLFPHAWVGLVVQPSIYNLMETCQYVDEVFPFHWNIVINRISSTYRNIFLWLLVVRFVRRHLRYKNIDIAISPRWNNDVCQTASLILMHVSQAHFRIGYLHDYNNRGIIIHKWLASILTHGLVKGFPKHEVERQLDLLRHVGANITDSHLEVWTTVDDESFAKQILERHGIRDNDLLYAFSPGAGWPLRRWPIQHFIELGQWLQDRYNVCILVIGNKYDEELGFKISHELHPERTVNLVGKTTLRQMAAVLRRCQVLVGNDSGPAHVAAAAGVRVVGLYGPGEHQRFRPWGANHRVVRLDLLCSPCFDNCMFDHPYCMEGITVDHVKSVLASLHPETTALLQHSISRRVNPD